jgi:hypothetical protein
MKLGPRRAGKLVTVIAQWAKRAQPWLATLVRLSADPGRGLRNAASQADHRN